MKTTGDKRRKHLGALVASLLCALLAISALAGGAAAAEEADSAPIRNLDEGGFVFPEITGPEAPEHYPFRVSLGEEQFLEPVTSTEVDAFNSGHTLAFRITAGKAHDAEGANVPTTLEKTAPDIVTLTVDFRAGNPAAGGAPFHYPIVGGEGWEGGFHTTVVPMTNPDGEAAPTPTPELICEVPALRGFSLRAAKARLRSRHCAIGKVHLARGATDAKGKVVKQFRVAGTELAAGTPVSIRLG